MRLEKSFNHAKYEQVIYEKSEKHIGPLSNHIMVPLNYKVRQSS
jgi:hypothetical protein